MELEETKAAKQENYIFREQEYRKVIQDMKDKIDEISQKPLERTRNKSEDQKEMENIITRTRLNDPTTSMQNDFADQNNARAQHPNSQIVNGGQWPPEQKTVDEIHKLVDDFKEQIGILQQRTTKGLADKKNKMWSKLDNAFTTHRKELMADSLKKKQNDEDPRVRENTLNNDLENMTHMA